jgi:hypothetical protein
VVALAARLVPPRHRRDLIDEWSDHVLSAGEEGTRPLLVAIRIAFLAAPRIALRYRLRRRAALYVVRLFDVYFEQIEQLVITPASARRDAGEAVGTRGTVVIVSRTLLAMMASTPLYLILGRRVRNVPMPLLTILGMLITLAPLAVGMLLAGFPGLALSFLAPTTFVWIALLPLKVVSSPQFANSVVNWIAGERLF